MISVVVALAVALAVIGTACQPAQDGIWEVHRLDVSGTYTPLEGNFAGDEASDLFWYGPGSAPDSLWVSERGARGASAFVRRAMSVRGTFRPVVGDFAGSEHDDILWHGVGREPDALWTSRGDGTFASTTLAISGSYDLYRLHDLRPDAKDSLFLHARSSARSFLWAFDDAGSGAYASAGFWDIGAKVPVVGDWDDDGLDDLFLHGPGAGASDLRWLVAADGTIAERSFPIAGSYVPTVVRNEGPDAILWWAGSPRPEAYWRSDGTVFRSGAVRDLGAAGTVTSLPLGAAMLHGPFVRDALFVDDGTTTEWYELASAGRDKANEVPIVGDFDGDGWVDVLWYAAGDRAEELWYLDGGDAARSVPFARALRFAPT
jgi:hypothetical protein